MNHKKRALVIEGGGMRGAHSCGALMALVECGFSEFDIVVGTSAGACTAAFFVSRQFELLPVIWKKYLHGRLFIGLNKIRQGRPLMDLDYLIDDVFGSLAPLDLEAIRKSPTRFLITATDCRTGETKYFDAHRDPLFAALKASAALPFAYRTVEIDGVPYIDGGASQAIPIDKAIQEGAEEVFLILTRPAGYRKKSPWLDFLPRYYQKKFPRLAELMMRRYSLYNETIQKIENNEYPCKLTVIRPSRKTAVSRLSTQLSKIELTIEQGYKDGLHALKKYDQFD